MAGPAVEAPAPAGSRAAAAGGLGFSLFSNTDLAIVSTMLPVALFHGQRVSPLVVSVVLSIQVGSALTGAILAPLLFGRLRPGLTLAVSSVLKAAGIAVLIAGSTPGHLYAFGLLGGFGLGVSRPAVRLLLNGSVAPGGRARIFQWFFIMVNLAHVLAPLLAELARDRATPALTILLAVELVGAAVIVVITREVAAEPRTRHPDGLRGRLGLIRDPRVLAVTGYTFVCYFGMGFVITMFQLYEVVTPALGQYRPLLLSYEPMILIVMQLALIPFFARLGRRGLYPVAAVTGGLGIVFAFTSSLVLVVVGLTLFALSECLALPKIQVEAAEVAPPGQTGAVFSLVTVFTAIGEIVGNLAAGLAVRLDADSWIGGPARLGMVVGVLVLVGMAVGGSAILRAHRPAAV